MVTLQVSRRAVLCFISAVNAKKRSYSQTRFFSRTISANGLQACVGQRAPFWLPLDHGITGSTHHLTRRKQLLVNWPSPRTWSSWSALRSSTDWLWLVRCRLSWSAVSLRSLRIKCFPTLTTYVKFLPAILNASCAVNRRLCRGQSLVIAVFYGLRLFHCDRYLKCARVNDEA